MPKLVVLSEGLTGRSYELKVDKTTIGRLEDNSFPIAEQSVSSHHCEILLKGNDVIVKDLNSTNGTYINGEKITEKALKPGQILRLGQIEARLEEITAGAAGREILVHCKMGGRSAKAAQFLRQQGFKNVKNLKGGILEWSDKIDPSVPKY